MVRAAVANLIGVLVAATAALASPPTPTPTPTTTTPPASPLSENPWADVRSASSGPASAIGGYSSGCVAGAIALPVRGPGFRVLRPKKQRHFAHPDLIAFLKKLGRDTKAAGGRPVAVGDLSMPRGGPAPNGHASHQSGLDADLGYGGASSADPFALIIDEPRGRVNRRWNRRVLALLRRAASDPRVSRIFVHPIIKSAACTATARWSDDKRSWLRTLRPWWGHAGHFHVRLQCPAQSPECKDQPPLPQGDGCAELSWWLDPARADERAKGRSGYQERVGAKPELPPACTNVLAAPPSSQSRQR